MIFLVKVNDVDDVWPRVKDHVERSLEHCSDLTMTQMLQGCRSGHLFLFVTENCDAAAIISFERWRVGEVCRLLTLGSSVSMDWKSEIEFLKSFARENGAVRFVTSGRKGWTRVLGAEPESYNYEVELWENGTEPHHSKQPPQLK